MARTKNETAPRWDFDGRFALALDRPFRLDNKIRWVIVAQAVLIGEAALKTIPTINFWRRGCVVGFCLALFALPWTARSDHLLSIGPLTAISTIDFNGNNVTIDSFDSGDPHHSDWQTNLTYHGTNFYGRYPTNPAAASGDPDPTEPYKRKDNARVATDANVCNIGNANIYGYVDTAPGGMTTVGAYGSVGDVFWVPTQGSIQPGHIQDDMNVIFPDVVLPANFLASQNVTKRNGANVLTYAGYTFNYVITNTGYWRIDTQVMDPIYIKGTNVFLYLPAGLSFLGNAMNATIYLETNSYVTIYTGGNIDTSGNTGINNIPQYAPAFAIFGLPGCTDLKLASPRNIVAYVYAPEAYLHMGSGGGTYAGIGAFFVHNIQLNGNMAFHYDESLGLIKPFPIWISTQPTNQIIHVSSNTTFSVSTGGSSPKNYRWFFNDQSHLLASGTNSSLSLTNVQSADAGNYFVVVTNQFNAVTSVLASLTVYTNAAATLNVLSSSTDGWFQFNIAGVDGLNYALQSSTNLVDWISLQTNVSPFIFTETNLNWPQCFYRTIFLP
jgi:hypothetical protein